MGMRETAIALLLLRLRSLAAEFTREATRKSIRASLPHSRFISTPNVKPADTLLCHLIESTALCAANNGWEFCSSARQWRDKRRKPTAPPRFQTSLSLSEHLHDYRSISNEIIVNAAQTAEAKRSTADCGVIHQLKLHFWVSFSLFGNFWGFKDFKYFYFVFLELLYVQKLNYTLKK